MTQLALDVIFRSLGEHIVDSAANPLLEKSIAASDPSEATVISASIFLDSVFLDSAASVRSNAKPKTPGHVGTDPLPCEFPEQDHRQSNEVQHPHAQGGAFPRGDEQSDSVCRQLGLRIVSRDDSVAPPSPLCTPSKKSGIPTRNGLRVQATPRFMAATAANLSKAKQTLTKEMNNQTDKHTTPSRGKLHRPSTFPQQPNISALSVSCDPSAEYAVVLSMFEVYNDRIFDLLAYPTKSFSHNSANINKRRHLPFKPTESSPDRKVVCGLRKVVCSDLNQALLVLEAGLHERRVAGTGSNSVSSRSHGFFCIEVKKRPRNGGRSFSGKARKFGTEGAPWSGATLSIVDLAGSERANLAKTTGVTLAEAGKINESLMYLGRCLQMQSDAGAAAIAGPQRGAGMVPFRQCKLTELLFANCYPSMTVTTFHASMRFRNPQKAVMIVTADPRGDYNATSQILRYSALAREVTVPRIPSITQAFLMSASTAARGKAHTRGRGSTTGQHSSPPVSPALQPARVLSSTIRNRVTSDGSEYTLDSPKRTDVSGEYCIRPKMSPPAVAPTNISAPPADDYETSDEFDPNHRCPALEAALADIERLTEEIEYLRQSLEKERVAHEEAEAHLLSIEDRMIDLEQDIREECATEFERRLELEMARFQATLQAEMKRGEEHWGRKLDIFQKGVLGIREEDVDDEDEDKENSGVVWPEGAKEENERLKRENESLKKEIAALKGASKRMPLKERDLGDVQVVPQYQVQQQGSLKLKGAETPSRPGTARSMIAPRQVTKPQTAEQDEPVMKRKMEKLRLIPDDGASLLPRPSPNPTKKLHVRRLGAKRWNALDEGNLY